MRMGDEELNFTDDEARCWADDPRNQANRKNLVWSALLVLILFGIALIAIAWLASASGSTTRNPRLGQNRPVSPATSRRIL